MDFLATGWNKYTELSLKREWPILLSGCLIVAGGMIFMSLALADEQPLNEVTSDEAPVRCSEHNTDIHKPGYIVLEVACDTGLCGGFADFIRDKCKGKTLLQNYCDPKAEEFHSTRSIECEKGCKYVRGYGHCIS